MGKALQPDEQELITSLKQGYRVAFDQIFKQYWEFVYISAYKRLQDEHAAKDIAQELFISLWVRRESLEIDNLSAWFYSSVRFKVISYIKSVQTDNRYHEQLATLKDDHYMLHAMEQQDTEMVFEYATNELPERMRQVFVMSRKHEKSIDEIADELQLSSQTVKNQLTSALKMVRKKLNYISIIASFIFLT